MRVKMKDVKVKLTEGEYKFLLDFVNSLRRNNPKHMNNISLSGLIKFAVFYFYMAYLMGKIGDLRKLKNEFLKRYGGQ